VALDISSSTPLYQQLRQELFSRIRRGDFGPGVMLPSENELCREYAVSVTTARRALLELVKEGVVRRRVGVGTMVAPSVRQAHLAFVSIDYAEDAWRENSAAMGELVAGIGELAWRRDASFSMSGVDEDRADEYLRSLADARSVDGVLLRTPNEVRDQSIDILESSGVPYVVIKRELPRRQLNCVVSDDISGARLATQHLLEAGHTRIGFVCAKPALTLTQNRLTGYRQALAAAGIKFDPRLIRLETSFGETMGRRAARDLLERPSRPTAVFAASDTMAIGGYQAARSLGLEIPGDVAFVGYDDIGPASLLEPSLTTVRTAYHDFGRLAAELLLDLIEGRVEAPQRVVIEPELIVRESTGKRFKRPRQVSAPPAAGGVLAGRRVLVGGEPAAFCELVGFAVADANGEVVGTSTGGEGAFSGAVWAVDARRGFDRVMAAGGAAVNEIAGRLAQHRAGSLVIAALIPERTAAAGHAAAAAAWVEEVTRQLAQSWSPGGVRVNAVLVAGLAERESMGPVLFFLSEAAAGLTGQVLRSGQG
jgi:YD repeat-containing protein